MKTHLIMCTEEHASKDPLLAELVWHVTALSTQPQIGEIIQWTASPSDPIPGSGHMAIKVWEVRRIVSSGRWPVQEELMVIGEPASLRKPPK